MLKKMKFTKIPLFIMVSRENESDTIEYFEKIIILKTSDITKT